MCLAQAVSLSSSWEKRRERMLAARSHGMNMKYKMLFKWCHICRYENRRFGLLSHGFGDSGIRRMTAEIDAPFSMI
ncbi:MAG TPA: hypothetical protein C5S51_00015 [Methanosarcinaceae archaeon]|nr:hypothetical protein [Methanosarcinaceae archaeon]